MQYQFRFINLMTSSLLVSSGLFGMAAIAPPILIPLALAQATDTAATLRQEGRRQNYAGQISAALVTLEQALAQAQQAGDRASEAATWIALGETYVSADDDPAAAEAAQQALMLYQELGDRAGEAAALRVLSFTQFEDTPNETAIATLQQAIDLANEFGSPVQQGILQADLGAYHIRLQKPEIGLDHINEAQKLLTAEPTSVYETQLRDYYQPLILAFTGLAQYRLGSADTALVSLEEARAIAANNGNPYGEAVAYSFRGIVQFEQEDFVESARSHQQASELFAVAENLAAQHGALNEAGGVLYSQGSAHQNSGRIEAAIAAYQASVAIHETALQVAKTLEDPLLAAESLNEIASSYVIMMQTLGSESQRLVETESFTAAHQTIDRAIALGQQSIQPALDSLALASDHQDAGGTQQAHVIVHISHAALGQAYDSKSLIYWAEGDFERSLNAGQEGLGWFQTTLRYALESGDPEIVARSQQYAALGYNGVGLDLNTLEQYDAALESFQTALDLTQQIPARGLTLFVLRNVHQNYLDTSEAAKAAGDLEQALVEAETALSYAQQALALAEAPLDKTNEYPVAEVLVDSAIVDTEEERQSLIESSFDSLWIYYNQIGLLHDELGNLAAAVEFYEQALAIAERLEAPNLSTVNLGSIAALQIQLSQYQAALTNAEKAVAIADTTNDSELALSSRLIVARIYDDLGRYPEAIAAYNEVLSSAQEQQLLAREATILNNLGVILTLQGDYAAALENFDQDLTLNRAIRTELEAPDALDKLAEYCFLQASETRFDNDSSSEATAVELAAYAAFLEGERSDYVRELCIETTWNSELKALNNIANVYGNQGRYQDALDLYEQSLEIARQDGYRYDEASVLSNMGTLYHNQGNYQQALEIHQEVLAIRQDLGDRGGVANSLNELGTVYNSQGRYREALDAYEEALALVQEIGLTPSEPTFLGNIGTVYSEQGRYDAAEANYEQSLELAKTLGFLPDQATQLKNLGVLDAQRGNYTQALDYAEQSLAIYREIGARTGESAVLEDIGNLYQFQGNFADALTVHQEALAIAQELADQDGEAYALLALGSTYERLGQYDQASGSYQDALTIFETIGSVAGEADALSSLGNVAEQQGQYADALSLYDQALAIHQASGSVEGESAVLIDIGFVQRRLGNFAAAETALQQSLQVQRQIGARANEGVTLTGLALVRDEQGTTPEALDLLQEALALHQELGDRPNEAVTLSDMGQLLAAQSQPELAIALLKQSVNLYESIRGDLRSLDTDLQASYTDSVADTYRTLADLLLSQNRILEAQRVLDLLKIQELDDYFQDVQRSAETASGVDFWQVETDLLALYQQVVDQAAELQVLEDKSPEALTDSEKQRLAELQAVRDQAEGWFYDFLDDPTVITAVDQIRTNSRGQNLEPENFPDLANNLRLLPQKTAAFYPLILEDRLELVLVLPEGPPLRYPVEVSSQALNQAIVNFGQALKTPSSDIQPLAQELYTWLIEPMSAQLEQAGIEALIYAPDGALRYIPLAALHDGEQYLAQRFNISHITAASLTDLNVQPQPQERQLLAAACAECEFTINVGNTQFDFPDLPFTEVEVKTLAEQVAGVDILLNQEFNASSLNNLSSYDVVHLATHAAFVTGSPDESFIVFGSGETISLRNIKREWTLDNAELVVLSACETAVGSTDLGSGIEILGLGYRIEQAGAQATLASLWQVSDGGTQKLMQAFYAAMQQDMSKSEALQAAQQAMITSDFSAVGGDRGLAVVANSDGDRSAPTGNTLAHPYYWAPFILIGNGL